MHRREFFKQSLAGASGLPGLAAGLDPAAAAAAPNRAARPTLFPTNLPSGEWVQFRAAGFSEPACGVIYRGADPVLHGMPLGGISTGFLDVDTNGTFGLTSQFNSGVPVRGPLRSPFLGVHVDGRTCVMTLEPTVAAANARDIHYWGHYPVADLEFETGAPVGVALRAWSPFIPGDAAASNIPAAVFEVHLRNTAETAKSGTVGFSFPGPTQAEAQVSPESGRELRYMAPHRPFSHPLAQGLVQAHRREITSGGFRGISVSSAAGNGYALGVIGAEHAPRFGAALWTDAYDYISGQAWNRVHSELPPVSDVDFSSSMALPFSLAPGETKVVRIVLAWYSPVWKGEGKNYFRRMYTRRYKDAAEVASAVARDHASLLRRILAWQQAVYTAEENPVWLRESLVNILHLIAKTSYWAAAQAPIGAWCREGDGLYGMNECPRECPQIECIPCSFYGNVPVVYFFPELALSTLRGYKAYQSPNGAAPWIFGGCTGWRADGYRETDGADMATPSPGHQVTLNGPCYIDMVDRYWQRTGDEAVLKEFYPSIKKNTIYTMGLRSGPDGIISVPEGNVDPTSVHNKPGMGLEWFEGIAWFGMTSHVGGIHLAHLRIAERMAEKEGDAAFARQCRQWIAQGSASLENKLWAGDYYLAYSEPETGRRSDLVFGYQLDGDWMCFYHGVPPVFRQNRARKTLDTIRRTCMALTPYGAANFATPEGGRAESEKFMASGWGLDYGAVSYFPPEVFMLAATYLYQGQRETGLELAKNCMRGIVKWGYTWTQPNIVDGTTGKRIFGSDYYQNLMLWAVPAAIGRQDLRAACGPDSLVDRMIRAAKA